MNLILSVRRRIVTLMGLPLDRNVLYVGKNYPLGVHGMGYDMEGMTEEEAMNKSGYLRIWDSGHIRWELTC